MFKTARIYNGVIMFLAVLNFLFAISESVNANSTTAAYASLLARWIFVVIVAAPFFITYFSYRKTNNNLRKVAIAANAIALFWCIGAAIFDLFHLDVITYIDQLVACFIVGIAAVLNLYALIKLQSPIPEISASKTA